MLVDLWLDLQAAPNLLPLYVCSANLMSILVQTINATREMFTVFNINLVFVLVVVKLSSSTLHQNANLLSQAVSTIKESVLPVVLPLLFLTVLA